MNELLFEIGTEEIPAGYIQRAYAFMAKRMEKQLAELGLRHGLISTTGTPRRLILSIMDIQDKQEDFHKEHIGPARKVAFDKDGNPTKAALGFARSRKITVEELETVKTDKGEYLLAIEEVKGEKTSRLLPDILSRLIADIPFPKSMCWSNYSLSFARPIQWLLSVYNEEVIYLKVAGIESSNKTCGHRFMAPDFFPVTDFKNYCEELEKRFVITDFKKRREMVMHTVGEAVAGNEKNLICKPLIDDKLLDTVTNLIEIPWGVCGGFDEKFLQLPREALITSMREHQKYFPVVNEKEELLPLFVAVNNTRINNKKTAVSGHERVLRARLEDGLFFFNEDKKQKLSDRLDNLSGIIFQQKLGTMAEKSKRIIRLAGWLAEILDPEIKTAVIRAAQLAKADLLTEMVGEFPSLQGIIGREYALLDGEKEEVAVAIAEHYMPIRAGSSLPKTSMGAIVGIADRIDTLAGCFVIGEKPTGNKDSFGLRRQAIGLISIIRGHKFSIPLADLIGQAVNNYQETVPINAKVGNELLDFIRLRFANELISSGQAQDVVEAATATGFNDIVDSVLRMEALENIRCRDSFVVLAGSFKRIRNITKDNRTTEVQSRFFSETAEEELYRVVSHVRDTALPLIDKQLYDQALEVLLEMKKPVDTFFDEVMVMDKDETIRQNRLNLLSVLRELVLKIGDISKMDKDTRSQINQVDGVDFERILLMRSTYQKTEIRGQRTEWSAAKG